MLNKEKMSHQGLRESDADSVIELKEKFKEKFVDGDGLLRTGYFVGKFLLKQILEANDDAQGIVISFGLNDDLENGGQLQLIIEPAFSNDDESTDVSGIIEDREKYTTGDPGTPGPDNLIPAIKPTIPKKPNS